MPAKPGVSKVRTVAPGSASGRGGTAGAALSRSESPSGVPDRCDHRMAKIRTYVRRVVYPNHRTGATEGAGRPNRAERPRTDGVRGRVGTLRSVVVRRELLAHVLHVELLDLLDQGLQSRLGQGAGLREDDDAVPDRHDRRDRADV